MTVASQQLVNFYELIGVPCGATANDIDEAFRRQYPQWGVRTQLSRRADRAYAVWMLDMLGQAEAVLRDPVRRSEYDMAWQRAGGQPAALAADAATWHDRAQHFLDEDDTTAAHRVALEAAAQSPGSPVVWMLRGYTSALLENFGDAEYELAEAARRMPGEALPRYLLGEVYAAQEKWEQALAKVEEALRLSPDNAPIIAAKAAVFGEIGREAQAVRLLEPLVARHPGDDMYALQLAAAYHDVAIGGLTRVPGEDGYIWTSEEQVTRLELAAGDIDGVQCRSQEAAQLAKSLREFAERGRQIHWDTSAPNLYLWLAGFAFLWGCGIGLGPTGNFGVGIVAGLLVSGVVAGGLFTLMRRKPAWKLAAQSLHKGNLSNRLMTATNRATAAVYRVLNP